MWRAIWNGPFFIGKLERPVSVGDVMLKVLETLWRTSLIAVGGVGTLVVTLLAWSAHSNAEGARALAQMRATVSYDPDYCGPQTPILVTLTNEGRRSISSLSYGVSITDGAGRNVAPYHLGNIYSSDEIPGRSFRNDCVTPWQTEYGADAYFSGYPEPTNFSATVKTAQY